MPVEILIPYSKPEKTTAEIVHDHLLADANRLKSELHAAIARAKAWDAISWRSMKELRLSASDGEPVLCIYILRSIPTGKFYVGGTYNFRKRIDGHQRRMARGKKSDIPKLQEFYRLHGEAGFEVGILERFPPNDDPYELHAAEAAWVTVLKNSTLCLNQQIPKADRATFHRVKRRRALTTINNKAAT